MGIQANGNFVHWNYFIALEQDLAKVSRFVEFSEDNLSVYSIELAHLLLAASSEVDVVLKALCKMKDPGKEHKNINDYKETVKAKLPSLIGERGFIHRFGLELHPWSNWNGDENPLWWRSYNNVKHQRDLYFREANLKHTLNAVAGLSLVVLYYYREVFSQENAHTFQDVTRRLRPETSLIDFDDNYTYARSNRLTLTRRFARPKTASQFPSGELGVTKGSFRRLTRRLFSHFNRQVLADFVS